MRFEKEDKIIFAIFIIALIIRIVFIFSSPVKWWDESVYANLGYDLSKNSLDYSLKNSLWSDFIPGNGNFFYSWPNIGFRAPLLPYFLSLFYFFKLGFFIDFIMPFIGALSVFIVYLIGKTFFTKKIGIYSAALFCVIPLHVYFSGKILTDVFFTFFVLLMILFFWKGFEENKNKYKILAGIFLGFSILARYNGLWFIPIFGLYLVIRHKGFKFLKDKYFWYSFISSLIVLLPIFVYGYFNYGNIFGAFIHGSMASSYWGGLQNWNFFFSNWFNMFSFIGYLFLLGLFYIFYKKEFLSKEIYFILIWLFVFFFFVIIMPHKEERLIMPMVPAICLLSGFFISKIKKYSLIFLIIFLFINSYFLFNHFYQSYERSYNSNNLCFVQGMDFFNKIDSNLTIVTEESSVVYYYTKKGTHYYINPWKLESFLNMLANDFNDKEVYVLFSLNGQYSVNSSLIQKDLGDIGEIVFTCDNYRIYKVLEKFTSREY